MRYLIVDNGEVFEKFEIDKTWLAKVKEGRIDLIIDTEENKYFGRETKLFEDDQYNWFDIKPYDKRYSND